MCRTTGPGDKDKSMALLLEIIEGATDHKHKKAKTNTSSVK